MIGRRRHTVFVNVNSDKHSIKRSLGLLVALLVLFMLGGLSVVSCGKIGGERGSVGSPVIFMLSPDHGAKLNAEDRKALAEMLFRESGLHVEVRVAASALDAIEAFDKEADLSILNLFEYILAQREYGVEAALQVTRKDGSTGYTGVILVQADGPIRTLNDLTGKRIAYSDPFSSSGFVFPAKLLADAGIKPVPEFAGNHEKALARLRAGDVDAAATFSAAVENDSALRVIARTDTIPNEPIFFRKWLRPELKARLVEAIQRIAATPEGLRILKSIADIEGVRPISDDSYLDVNTAIRAAGSSAYEVVPEGIRVESRRRGINLGPSL